MHLTGVIRAFAFVKNRLQLHMSDWSDIEWVSCDWSEFYPSVKGENIPLKMPELQG
jgi:hypothetical protein